MRNQCWSLSLLSFTQAWAQPRVNASAGRSEYIEVEPNVKLHVTDLGEGKPVVLIHGWPLSDAMYEYQYSELVKNGFRVIGITLRGFGKSDKPYGKYNYDVYADDIKVILDKLKIEKATLGGFSMGGAISIHYVARHNSAHVAKLVLFGAAAPVWAACSGFTIHTGLAGCRTRFYNSPTSWSGSIVGLSGTSMAAPHTAGLLALIASHVTTGAPQIKSVLTSTADDLGVAGVDPIYGNGRINARRAMGL